MGVVFDNVKISVNTPFRSPRRINRFKRHEPYLVVYVFLAFVHHVSICKNVSISEADLMLLKGSKSTAWQWSHKWCL